MENIGTSNEIILDAYIACILPSDEYESVQGITTLNDRMYIVKNGSKQIDVFSATDYSRLDPILADIENPCGLVSCSQYDCLYTNDDRFNENTYRRVYYIAKVELSTLSVHKWRILAWVRGLSLMKSSNLLVSAWDLDPSEPDKLLEYTSQGQLMRVITLGDSLDCIYHAVELSTNIFAVCHTGIYYHRVCTVNGNGRILQIFGNVPGSNVGELDLPINLATDGDGIIFVADRANNRVQMLSSTLDYLGDVNLKEIQLNTPRRIHFDQLTSRLYISHRN